jgi:hypothetical protein
VPAEELFHLCRHGFLRNQRLGYAEMSICGKLLRRNGMDAVEFLPSGGVNGFHPFRLTDGVNMDAMRLGQQALGSQQNAEHVGTQMLIQRFSRLPLFEKVKKVFIFHITKEGVTQAARLLSMDSTIERSVCTSSFCFSGSTFMVILTTIMGTTSRQCLPFWFMQ